MGGGAKIEVRQARVRKAALSERNPDLRVSSSILRL
jgi:hypothetical protein